tara:strand:- start:4222 stop:4692 length:471 start_codon:yes stop_codon:yes gene_type:complete
MRRLGAAVSETYTAAQYPKYAELGELRYNGGNVYEFVLFVDLDTEVGDVVYPASTTGTSVSIDYTGGSSLSAKGKGFSVAAVDISEKPYGWIQRAGVHSAVRTDGGVSAGEAVIGHSVDGEVDTMADGEEELVVGFALATDGGSPTTSAVQIHGCL